MDEKLFELFYIKNKFAKYFTKFGNLCVYLLLLYITVIPENDKFLYYRTN